MSIYTNEGLVRHAKRALQLKTRYMWGGILREITPAYIDLLRSMYGTRNGTGYSDARYKTLQADANKGVYGCDCVGLIKSYYWSGNPDGGVGSPKYSSNSDVNAGGMYSLASEKGKIDTLPEVPGIILISRTSGNHVGIYLGCGETIECTLGQRGDGVVKRKLDSLWSDWFKCSFIEYKQPVPTSALKTVKLAFNAKIRSAPRYDSESLGVLTAGTRCIVCTNSKQTDPASRYEYVKLYGHEGWIVTSAL